MTSPTEDQTPETTNQILARYHSVGNQTPPRFSQEQILDRAKDLFEREPDPWPWRSWKEVRADARHRYFHRAKAALEAEEEGAK